ncbi:MAG TPA: hypothetical protein VHF06_20910 [Pseudonocardiaceae bacterium]|jgi:hypothetical protein|nr:hypothetical protein [Pseudonocardiaceae bacterium]
MATLIGDRLPPDLVRAFDGTDLDAKIGPAYPLITVDESGAPRLSMLSAGELLAVDERTVRIGLWPNTRTGRNLATGREVLLCVAEPGSVRYVRGVPWKLLSPDPAVDCFEMAVRAVESDSHDGMPVTTGITFDVVRPGRAEVLAMWQGQVAALRAARPGTE